MNQALSELFVKETPSETRERIRSLLGSISKGCGNSANPSALHGAIMQAGFAYTGSGEGGSDNYILQGKRGARILTVSVCKEDLLYDGMKGVPVLHYDASHSFGYVPLNDIGKWIGHLDVLKEREEREAAVKKESLEKAAQAGVAAA
jgi:hypothetical protein